MTYVKWFFRIAFLLGAFLFLHYNLPQRDIVRVVGTFEIRDDKPAESFGAGQADAGSKGFPNRDVRYITTKRPNGRAMVYRNTDTGWGWPPYFKFDTSNLTADAQDLIQRGGKNDAEEIWVAVRHYGWRIELVSLYPNAVSFKEVEGPNVRLMPWFNIALLTLLGLIALWIFMRIRRFKKARIDPVTDKIEASVDSAVDKVSDTVSGATEGVRNKDSGFRKFMRRWLGSK